MFTWRKTPVTHLLYREKACFPRRKKIEIVLIYLVRITEKRAKTKEGPVAKQAQKKRNGLSRQRGWPLALFAVNLSTAAADVRAKRNGIGKSALRLQSELPRSGVSVCDCAVFFLMFHFSGCPFCA